MKKWGCHKKKQKRSSWKSSQKTVKKLSQFSSLVVFFGHIPLIVKKNFAPETDYLYITNMYYSPDIML